jgi:hypothetical protein
MCMVSAGEYYAALQQLLLSKSSIRPLWPVILHDWFHSGRCRREWNKRHLQGPENKCRRIMIIIASRAYHMLGHPDLYQYIGARPLPMTKLNSQRVAYRACSLYGRGGRWHETKL